MPPRFRQLGARRVNPAWSPVSVTLSLAGLAQVDDNAGPFQAELLPAPRGNRADVLGAVEDPSRRGAAVAAPEPAARGPCRGGVRIDFGMT